MVYIYAILHNTHIIFKKNSNQYCFCTISIPKDDFSCKSISIDIHAAAGGGDSIVFYRNCITNKIMEYVLISVSLSATKTPNPLPPEEMEVSKSISLHKETPSVINAETRLIFPAWYKDKYP
jgi:hypothetical protein